MKIVALLSGGKDSLYNLYLAIKQGHECVAIANMKPPEGKGDELDSYMYQTVGHQAIEYVAKALELPLYRANITGVAENQELNYEPDDPQKCDEVEQLYQLLLDLRQVHKIEFDAISVGAIASTYQRTRCESICKRLNLTMLAYLWGQNQKTLLQDMIDADFDAILIKVACMGLKACHLGKSIKEMQEHLERADREFGANICGEGGEYETLVLDCPLYRQRIKIISEEIIHVAPQMSDPVCYMNPTKLSLEEKS